MENNSFIIENLLLQNQSNRVIFSTSISKEEIAMDITALINSQGGDLLLGVDREKNIVGIESIKTFTSTIQEFLFSNILPIAPIFIKVITYQNKDLLLISVWEGAKKPYSFNRQIYTRIDNETRNSSAEDIVHLISSRKGSDFNWERIAALGVEMEDLDANQINFTIGALRGRYPDKPAFIDNEDFLIQNGLMLNGNITNACVLLFAKNPVKFIPQSRIRLTVYPKDVSKNTFLEDRFFEGNIFENIKSIVDYLDALYGKTININNILRTEKDNYPKIALREGIVNAIVHRDYNSGSAFLHISIFSDRTEIRNYGGLPIGLTIQDLEKEHRSILRNPDIAQICYYRDYMEMMGSGSLRIINECETNGFRKPTWSEGADILTLTFPGVAHQKTDGITEGITEGIKYELNEDQRLLLEYISKYPMRRVPDMVAFFNKSVPTIERNLKVLKEKELIEYVGANRTGGYVTINK